MKCMNELIHSHRFQEAVVSRSCRPAGTTSINLKQFHAEKWCVGSARSALRNEAKEAAKTEVSDSILGQGSAVATITACVPPKVVTMHLLLPWD